MIAIDDQTKETVTAAEIDTAFPALFLSGGIHTPVFVIVGDQDAAFCDPATCTAAAGLTLEAGFYPPDACAETSVIAGAGHNLNLHFQAQQAYDAVLEWLDRRVGGDMRVPPPSPCQP